MNKTELVHKMEKYSGSSFISLKELQEFLGYKGANSVRKYVTGLQTIRGSKKYFIPDVADALLGRR